MDSVAPRSGVQTLDRAVAVLDAVARSAPCSLADLVRETGLARPTAHRLAVALEGHGLVVRDRDGRFRLGARLVGWGAAAGAALALVEPARDILQRLSEATGESAQLYVREGDQRVCVVTHERPTGLRDTVPLGAVMKLTRGSGGRVLLAFVNPLAKPAADGKQRLLHLQSIEVEGPFNPPPIALPAAHQRLMAHQEA